jgi:hypothetical protein
MIILHLVEGEFNPWSGQRVKNMAEVQNTKDIVDVNTRRGWRKWLEENQAISQGAWLIIYKKGSSKKGPSYEEAVEEAAAPRAPGPEAIKFELKS